MSLPRNDLYAFGRFRLDAARKVLLRDGELVALPPKAIDLLVVLVESAGELVTKEELLRRVWPDTFVEEGNLPVNVFTLRKALGDTGEEFIKTIPKRGYCFVGKVGPSNPRTPGPSDRPARPFRVVVGALLVLVAALTTLSYVRTSKAGALTLTGQVQTLAVLPFSYTGPDPADDYIGPGFASAVADSLARLKTLIVRPMASTLKYGGPPQDLIEAGRALQAAVVLSGSVRHTADDAQVEATLVRVEDGVQIWNASSTEVMASLPALERTIASAVGGALGALPEQERAALATPRTANLQAYLFYLQGREASHHMTPRDLDAALGAFTHATAADAAFAEAHSGLSAFLTLPMNQAPILLKYEQGVAAATRALALNDRLAEPHVVLGRAAVVLRWDWSGAEREYRQAIARAPYEADPHFWYALHLSATGRHDDALSEIRFALQLDPTSPRVNLYLGMLLTMARRYDEAIAQLRKTPIEMGVTNQQVYLAMAAAQMTRGRADEAMATLDRAIAARATPTPAWDAHRAYVLAASGKTAEARRILADLDQRHESGGRPNVTVEAAAFACAGQMDQAFARLTRAVEERDSRVIFLTVDPLLDCARTDPRFTPLARRMKLDPRR
jgi:DNA-binding winged helix-turn-helix (wHTH) protein/TolB-like protein